MFGNNLRIFIKESWNYTKPGLLDIGARNIRMDYGETSPCESQKKNKSKKLRPLNLQDLSSAFFILGFGVLMWSFLVFLDV
jgi:hypothetical protein